MAEYYNDPYRRIRTLEETKLFQLDQKYSEKQERLEPTPPPPEQDLLEMQLAGRNRKSKSGMFGNLGDVAEASIYNAIYNIGDAITDTTRDPNVVRQMADEAAGVDQNYRQAQQQGQEEVYTSLANDNYWDAAGSAIKSIPYTLADSAATIPEYMAGAALTAVVPPLGAAVLGRRIKKTVDTATSAMNRYEKAVKAAKNGSKKAAKAVSQTSLITADMVQQQRNEYVKKYGEQPSTQRLAGSIAMTMFTMAWTPTMIKKLYLPTGKKLTGDTIRAKFKNEVKDLMKYAERGTVNQLTRRIVSGSGKIVKAGGAEALQEYAQSWAEILGVHYGHDEALNQISTAFEEHGDRTLQAAFLGGAAGSGARAVTAVPTTALLGTVDVAAGIGKASGRALKNRANRINEKLLSDEQKEEIKQEFAIKTAQHEELKKQNASKYTEVHNAKKFEDITDPEIQADVLRHAGQGDVTDPEVFKSAAKRAAGDYSEQTAVSAIKLKADKGLTTAIEKTKTAARTVAKVLPMDEIEYAAKYGRVMSKRLLRDLNKWEGSTTYALARHAMDASIDGTKEGTTALFDIAKQHTPKAVKEVAAALHETMPKLSNELTQFAGKMERAHKATGRQRDSLLNMDSLSLSVRSASNTGKVENKNIPALEGELIEDMRGRIEDRDTVKALKAAINVYKKTGRTGIPAKRLALMEAKLARVEKVLSDQPVAKATEKVKTVVDKVAEKVGIADIGDLDSHMEQGVKWVKEGLSTIDSKIDKLVNDFIDDKQPHYKVNRTANGEKLVGTLKGAVKEIYNNKNNPEGVRAVIDHVTSVLSTGKVIKSLSDEHGTTDPDAIWALAKDILPTLNKKENARKYKARVKEVLADVDQKSAPEVENVAEKDLDAQGKVVKENKTEQKKEEVKKEVKEEVKEEVTEEVTEEDNAAEKVDSTDPVDPNYAYIAKDLSSEQETVNKFIDDVLSEEIVCKL